MSTTRLEAFSDAVIAIAITIMVLEMKVPHGTDLEALRPTTNVLVSYVLSFIYLAIYWNNHHHMMVLTKRVNGSILWANMHLLFWLSLIPFVTGWMGENHFAPVPAAAYGVVLLMSAVAYFVLQGRIIADQGEGSVMARAVARDYKGKLSVVLYAVAVGLAFVNQWVSVGIYALVATIWLVPDRRIERSMPAAGE